MRERAAHDRNRDWRLVLILLFFLSGTSGLIYEIVWLRMLIRVFGVTAYAVSTVLVVYMAGLAAGSLLVGRHLRAPKNLLATYGLVEILIGISALVSTSVMGAMPSLYHEVVPWIAGSPWAIVGFRFVSAVLVLSIPTCLMGATLPITSAYLAERRGRLAGEAGVLYGANTIGAVIGVLGSGFFFIFLLGERHTTFLAIGTNLIVGLVALLLSRRGSAANLSAAGEEQGGRPAELVMSEVDRAGAASSSPPGGQRSARDVLVLYAVSGFCALSYQVIWSRMLTLLLGNSVYGFSLMLGVYLVGIGGGSLAMSKLASKLKRPIFVFGLLEIALSILALASLIVIVEIGLGDADKDRIYTQIYALGDFGRMTLHSFLTVLPVTLVLGALFPVVACALRARGGRLGESAAEAVGRLYGYNTLGAIVGSFVTGFILLSWLGTSRSFILVSFVSFLIGAYLLRMSKTREGLEASTVWMLGAIACFLLVLGLAFRDPLFDVLVTRVERLHHRYGTAPVEVLAHREDHNATVTMFRDRGGSRDLYINGILVSSTAPGIGMHMIDMPLSFHPAPHKVLIVGLGVGEAFKTALDRGLRTTVVDLLPAVAELFEEFGEGEKKYTTHPNARVVINDGRNFLLGTQEKFDFVFVDGTPPVFASGTVNLYSKEFLELVREHLNAKGIFALWFPTVCFESDFWMLARNFSDVFAGVSLWADPRVTGIILLGSPEAGLFGVGKGVLERQMTTVPPEYRENFAEFVHQGQILSEEELRSGAARYPPVTDDRPYTEFPLFEFWRRSPYHFNSKFLFGFRDEVRGGG